MRVPPSMASTAPPTRAPSAGNIVSSDDGLPAVEPIRTVLRPTPSAFRDYTNAAVCTSAVAPAAGGPSSGEVPHKLTASPASAFSTTSSVPATVPPLQPQSSQLHSPQDAPLAPYPTTREEIECLLENKRILENNVEMLKALALQLATQLNLSNQYINLQERRRRSGDASKPTTAQSDGGGGAAAAEPPSSTSPALSKSGSGNEESTGVAPSGTWNQLTEMCRAYEEQVESLRATIRKKDELIEQLKGELLRSEKKPPPDTRDIIRQKDGIIERLVLEIDQLHRLQGLSKVWEPKV